MDAFAKMPSKNTRADELLAGTCAVIKDFTAHNDKKCGAARLTRLCRTTQHLTSGEGELLLRGERLPRAEEEMVGGQPQQAGMFLRT